MERIRFDYGIDMQMQTYNRLGEVENGRVLFQLKATNRLAVSRDGDSVLCRVDRADLQYWLGELMPVILVQYDAIQNVGYWINVQEHLRDWKSPMSASKQTTLALPRRNVLDRKAVKVMARKKNAILKEMQEGRRHAN